LSLPEFGGSTPNDCVKERHPLSMAKIRPIICHTSETMQVGGKLHRKSHTDFPLVPKLVTVKLNDLKQRNGRCFASFCRTENTTHVTVVDTVCEPKNLFFSSKLISFMLIYSKILRNSRLRNTEVHVQPLDSENVR